MCADGQRTPKEANSIQRRQTSVLPFTAHKLPSSELREWRGLSSFLEYSLITDCPGV